MLRNTFVELIKSHILQRREQIELSFGDAIDDSALLGADRTITAHRVIWIERNLEPNFTAMTRSLVGILHRNSSVFAFERSVSPKN